MKRRFTGWLALVLAAAFLLAACGGPSPGQPQQAPGERGPASAVSGPAEAATSPASAPSAPAPGPEEGAGAPESASPPASGGAEASPESAAAPDAEADPPADVPGPDGGEVPPAENTLTVTEDGWYNTKDEVALYIHLYDRLPGNYVTKNEAEKKGWQGGSVEKYTGEGTAIGGNRFGNYEGLLPEAKGRRYTECDINTVGKKQRGAERIIFSNDGLIYYTGDHYKTFERLYGEP